MSGSLATTAAATTATTRSLGVVVNGAGSRPLDRRAAPGQSLAWFGGDLGRDSLGGEDGRFGLGEAGLGHNFGSFQINGVFGRIDGAQDTGLGGMVDTRASYIKLEVLKQLTGDENSGLWGALTAAALWGEADITRGYALAGGGLDASRGTADLTAQAIRARLQYANAMPMISPYGELSYSHSCLGGYTETGGAFPAVFDRLCDDNTEVRVGFDAEVPVASNVTFIGTLEGVHRFEDQGQNVTGQVIGLGAFDLGGPTYQQDWVRAGVGVTIDMRGSSFSVMANATSKGEATDAWIAANWSIRF